MKLSEDTKMTLAFLLGLFLGAALGVMSQRGLVHLAEGMRLSHVDWPTMNVLDNIAQDIRDGKTEKATKKLLELDNCYRAFQMDKGPLPAEFQCRIMGESTSQPSPPPYAKPEAHAASDEKREDGHRDR